MDDKFLKEQTAELADAYLDVYKRQQENRQNINICILIGTKKTIIIILLIFSKIRNKWWFIRKIFSNLFVCLKKSRTFAPVKHRGVEQLVARWAHNPKVIRSSRISATKDKKNRRNAVLLFYDNSSFTDFIHNLISVINKDINKVINRLIGL